MNMHFLKRYLSLVGSLLFLVLCCSVSLAQVPEKKDDLTVKDRDEWRNVLKWPDECERGFREYQQYSPPGGLNFNKLGKREYLVSVGCSGGNSIFMYYRENSNAPARLLKFKEYDRAHGIKDSSYSKVNFLVNSFNPEGNVLWIYSKTSTENMYLMHKYTFRRGRPVLIRTRKIRCSDVV
jgi:hypothetical protein